MIARRLALAVPTFLALLLGFTLAAAAVPLNDDFSNALQILPGFAIDGTNVGATHEVGEPNHAGRVSSVSVWYYYTAAETGRVGLSTAGSNFDTMLAVYTGSAVNALSPVNSNDDEFPGHIATSKLSFAAVAGVTYRIAVDGFNNATGNIHIAMYGEDVIATAVQPAGAGTATGAGTYHRHDPVTLVATPTAGFAFINWSEGAKAASEAATYTFASDADHSFVANFASASANFTVTVSASRGGTTRGGGKFHSATMVTVVARPADGFAFYSWTENGVEVSRARVYTFRVGANRTLQANFTPRQRIAVALSPPGSGRVTGGGFYPRGYVAYLIATAKPRFAFDVWTENGKVVSTDSSYSFKVTRSRSLIANFRGPEFRVNTYTYDQQGSPAIARLVDGTFVVVWTSEGQDGSSVGVYGQRFSAIGKPLGREFRVNAVTAGEQTAPTVVGLAGGDFVVAWTSEGSLDDYNIKVRRYKANGVPLGGEFVANSHIPGEQYSPSLAAFADGRFVVAWTSTDQDGSGSGIYAQLFQATGAHIGLEIPVNAVTQDNQYGPSVAVLKNGDFVIAWTSDNQDTPVGSGVFAQRFHSSGKRAGGEFQANTFEPGYQEHEHVAALAGGGFAIVWHSNTPAIPSTIDVFGQVFKPNGQRAGVEFRVHKPDPEYRANPAVAGLPNGGFMVLWVASEEEGPEIYARGFNAAGKWVSREERVNPTLTGGHNYPAFAVRPDGSAMAVWEAVFPGGAGTDVYGVARGF